MRKGLIQAKGIVCKQMKNATPRKLDYETLR